MKKDANRDSSRRFSKGHYTNDKKSRVRSMIRASHVLIAVVAIIECLILISFTTYSWIETSSSLIIETGKKYLTDTNPSRLPIAKALNYKFTINSAAGSDSDVEDLNTFFSMQGKSTDQDLYRYARTSSANGKDFFFKKENTVGGASSGTAYRAGDTADINAGYTYFDFTLSNKGSFSTHKYKFYFADANVFTVTNGEGSSLTDSQLLTIKNAMRISFQTGAGTPKIYSATAQTYNAISGFGSNSTMTTASVTTTAIAADANQRLFTIGKNSDQNISVRIWLEEQAPGLSDILATDNIAGADISVNLRLTFAQNDYDYLYFDDYTFSSGLRGARNTGTGDNLKGNIGGHLTEDDPESDNYRMYFVYRTSNSTTGYVYPMTIDNGGSNMDAKSWVTCDSSGSAAATVPDITNKTYITNLTTANNAALTYSYFAYGKCALSTQTNNNTSNNVTLSSATTAVYTWKLNGAGSSDAELRYSAYSATAVSSAAASSTNQTNAVSATGGYGAGGWSYNTPLSMVYFRDLATGVTDSAYNAGTNFKYITNAVGTATDNDGNSDTHRVNNMYINQTATVTGNENNARATATMYYDKGLDGGNGLFKSWVPSSWLTSGNRYFHYCSGTYYSNNSTSYSVIDWNAPAATKPANSNMYIFSALGYSQTNTVTAYMTSTTAATGVGCWNAIESEPVYFSTELIDNYATSAFRYQIGVYINTTGTDTADSNKSYYNLIPDETKTKFYAYIPVPGTNTTSRDDYADGLIAFRSYTTYNGSINAKWWGRVRSGSRTYYPVAFNTTSATTSAPKGYWNLGVIVDGTYEHFFWDYGDVSVSTDDGVLGYFYYNTTGHAGTPTYTEITPNMIDEYRWYVPLDGTTIGATIPQSVYFKWVPYAGSDGTFGTSDDTVFTYSLYISDGIYCVITEAEDNTPTNAFD